MVTMRVRTHDRGDPLTSKDADKLMNMRRIIAQWTGIDHCHIAMANNISLRPCIAERRRIARQHPPDQRTDLFGYRIGLV